VTSGDLVMTMGAGTITDVGSNLLRRLERRPTAKSAKNRHSDDPSGIRIQEQSPLSLATTMRVGGPADFLIRASSEDGIVAAFRWAVQRELPVTVIGGGSNVLASDAGIRGLTIIVKAAGAKALQSLWHTDHGDFVELVAPAQAPISGVGRYCAEQGWSGMDWAVGLPGQIGGATVNNAGAHGTELKDHLVSIDLLDEFGQRITVDAAWLGASYRMTKIKGSARPRPWIVLGATFRLPKSDPVHLIALADEHASFRKRTQPSGPCSGSTFANPEGDYAGRLLETAGLKGFTIGAMQFSPKHANWVVNTGGGTASDAWDLIMHGQDVVRDRFGIELRPEIERVGDGDAWESTSGNHE
ncbi:MAG: UDP-N-acetylmuramate dehydrogenase, partial [Thermomicrobiales bacterium]